MGWGWGLPGSSLASDEASSDGVLSSHMWGGGGGCQVVHLLLLMLHLMVSWGEKNMFGLFSDAPVREYRRVIA